MNDDTKENGDPESLCGATKDSFTCNLPPGHKGDHKDTAAHGRGLVGWSASLYDHWVCALGEFGEEQHIALLEQDSAKAQSWKGMAVDDLVNGALQHLGKFQDSGREKVELVHAANYLMLAWARRVEGECPECGEKMRPFTDDSQKSWTPISGYTCDGCGRVEI